ncbi:MAG: leucine-rich repeat domain-containing protein, partial [Synergistaceae bacterium]|nr:leucine-rich repeat domain-containing protein [Synergistaceae bacterium]
MRKALAVVVFLALMCGGAWADVAVNATNFPDDNFRSYVSSNFDTDSNGVLSDEEIANVTSIYVSGRGISSLQGVEHFTALTSLYCEENQLTALDVTNNTALTSLECSGNQLTALDVSNNTALEWLSCSNNKLTALDVSKNTALATLECFSNQLTALDVTN